MTYDGGGDTKGIGNDVIGSHRRGRLRDTYPEVKVVYGVQNFVTFSTPPTQPKQTRLLMFDLEIS